MLGERVIQAFFPERKPPAAARVSRFARTVFASGDPQRRGNAASPSGPVPPSVIHPKLRPPHPAATPRSSAAAGRPPHRAKVLSPKVVTPHAASVQAKANVRAFRTPHGFLAGTKSGEPLAPALLKQMEGYFETDFSDVRVHIGGEAPAIGALAFTVGSDLYFAPGHYQPHTQGGRELIGHELAHVVQQRDGRVGNPFGNGVAVVHDEELEAEADRHGRAAAQAKFGGVPRGFGAVQPAVAGSEGRYRLLVGAYLHDSAQPELLAGHSFVAIERPDGQRSAFGFSPAHYGSYDPHRDLARLKTGVAGVVHDDVGAFDKPGVKTRAYAITSEQARSAMAKVNEYRAGRHSYSADRRQCSTFVSDVMHAAGVASEPLPVRPRLLYEALDADES